VHSGSPASSTTKTGRHDIAEIFLKVALSATNQNQISIRVSSLILKIPPPPTPIKKKPQNNCQIVEKEQKKATFLLFWIM
jgi:hypothetical protein